MEDRFGLPAVPAIRSVEHNEPIIHSLSFTIISPSTPKVLLEVASSDLEGSRSHNSGQQDQDEIAHKHASN